MLTAKIVSEVFMDCLFKAGEDTSNAKIVEGVVATFGFNPDRLESHKAEIVALLAELPVEFSKGWTFLNACLDRNGRQWGEHTNIEQLVCLGIAVDKVAYCLPKDLWSVLPGGMPYFQVKE